MKIQLERPCTFSGCRSWDSDRDDVTITLQDGWATVVDNIGAYAYSYPAEMITGVVYSGAEALRMAKGQLAVAAVSAEYIGPAKKPKK